MTARKKLVNKYICNLHRCTWLACKTTSVAPCQKVCIEVAVRKQYDAGKLKPEVQFELTGLWPPPCGTVSGAPPCKKKRLA